MSNFDCNYVLADKSNGEVWYVKKYDIERFVVSLTSKIKEAIRLTKNEAEMLSQVFGMEMVEYFNDVNEILETYVIKVSESLYLTDFDLGSEAWTFSINSSQRVEFEYLHQAQEVCDRLRGNGLNCTIE